MVARLVRLAALLFAATIVVGSIGFIRDRNAEVRDLRAEATMFRATAYAFTYATPTPTATPTRTPRTSDDPYAAAVSAKVDSLQKLINEFNALDDDSDFEVAAQARALIVACQEARDPEPILPAWRDYDATLDRAMDLCVEAMVVGETGLRSSGTGWRETASAKLAEFNAVWAGLNDHWPR